MRMRMPVEILTSGCLAERVGDCDTLGGCVDGRGGDLEDLGGVLERAVFAF